MTPRSRFNERAKARKRSRIPSKTERRARSPREPRGALLRYQRALWPLGDAFEAAVRAVVVPELERFAGEGQSARAAKLLVGKLRRRLEAAPQAIARRLPAIGAQAVQHSASEWARLKLPTAPPKRARQTRTDAAADGGVPTPSPRRGIRIRDVDPSFGPLIDKWRRENVDKITSLVGHELDVIEQLLADGEGRRVESLRGDIEKRFDVTRSKADLLARDQTLKLNAQITQERARRAGITEYIWTTSNDERVRTMHAELEGQRFRWDDPPVTNEQGDRNHPGEDYQCRCTAFPVLDEFDDEGLFDLGEQRRPVLGRGGRG